MPIEKPSAHRNHQLNGLEFFVTRKDFSMVDTAEYQCPTCGRIREDWGNETTRGNAITLNKGKQRSQDIDRIADYRKWRWGIGNGCYVCDIDHLEYRITGNKIIPVALLELTRVDGNIKLPDTYLSGVLDRFKKRDAQSKLITYVAELLSCKVWIVLFRHDLSEFWLYNLSSDRGWYKSLSLSQYTNWIKKDCGINGEHHG